MFTAQHYAKTINCPRKFLAKCLLFYVSCSANWEMKFQISDTECSSLLRRLASKMLSPFFKNSVAANGLRFDPQYTINLDDKSWKRGITKPYTMYANLHHFKQRRFWATHVNLKWDRKRQETSERIASSFFIFDPLLEFSAKNSSLFRYLLKSVKRENSFL